MPMIELHFPVLGQKLPTDHGYALYSALSRLLPAIHCEVGKRIAIGPIPGTYTGNGSLALDQPRSRLRIRLPDDQIAQVLPLAGKSLDVSGHAIRIGVPTVRAIEPAPALFARCVTLKHHVTPETFLEAVRRDLDALGIQGEAGIPLIVSGPRAGQTRRRIIRIKGTRVVGFSLRVAALTAQESVALQEAGLGGRRRMGCGFFVQIANDRK